MCGHWEENLDARLTFLLQPHRFCAMMMQKAVTIMNETSRVLEYKCPCCGAALTYAHGSSELACGACGNHFDMEAVQAYNDDTVKEDTFSWEAQSEQAFSEAEQAALQTFTCPSCAGVLITDGATAATFCPFCGNPAILPGRLSGDIRPDGLIPFHLTREDALDAFARFARHKPLLPKDFLSRQKLEKVSGVYVPFWLYDCDGSLDARYRATRVHTWSDGRYHYTKTSHYLLRRGANAQFGGIPMDASSKMDDTIMESIEPFDYAKLTDFDTAYLSGYLADKYDVPAVSGAQRVKERVAESIDALLQPTFAGYASVVPQQKQVRITQSKAKYVLLPVWMLTCRYGEKTYTYAMNAQTGKLTGTLPVSVGRAVALFAAVAVTVGALAAALLLR